MLVVSTAAATTALTTRDAFKAAANLTSTTDDDFIDTLIVSISDQVNTILGVATATDGTRTIGRETLVETIRSDQYRRYGARCCLHHGHVALILSRYPIVSVTSITEDDVAVDAADYEIDGASGMIKRLDSDALRSWYAAKIVVTYVAGWLLPNDTGRNLPYDLEDAVISMIKASRFGRDRDPAIKSESMLQRTYEYELFAGTTAGGPVPADAMATLNRYRNIHLG